ncbi:MAG: amino acid decarboxylase [Ruminococcaceae bacterium]|nr:amino acid decarboxylase [Oscillospiraceae bacterium]
MKTPICDFVRRYAESDSLRLHMPGHKGASLLGIEQLDITEICGADSLYEASGIIRESEENASRLFGADTFYSTEGSSLCIRAMLYLATKKALAEGKRPLIAASRNVHKVFIYAAAMLDIDIKWLYPKSAESYISSGISVSSLEEYFADAKEKPTAVYLTSPDYLGNTADIAAISAVCKREGVLLLVDNAHGAYLKFLPESRHPIDLGADICCDSAHKTLPALTGAAYLHISRFAPSFFRENAKDALALFGSTSPSYLILQSLDAVNKYIAEVYKERLASFVRFALTCREKLEAHGFTFCGDEPLKMTIHAKKYGYLGTEFADILRSKNIECEFSDPDFAVLMLTPETGSEGLKILTDALLSIPRKAEIEEGSPVLGMAERAISIREALFSESEKVPVEKSLGRVSASANVSCPPAVPIVVCGERIDETVLKCFEYYGIDEINVVK